MPITLPDFKNTHCISLTACGEIKTTDRELSKWLKRQKRSVADLRSHGPKSYIRASLGGYGGKHFHVDITQESYDSKTRVPAQKSTLEEIQKNIDRIMGKEMEVDFRGSFEIKINELPENGIIKSLFFQTQLGDVAIKMKAAKLSIKGGPVTEIIWQALKDEKTIGIVIEAEHVKTVVSENYLINALATLETALKVFILGKLPNEPK